MLQAFGGADESLVLQPGYAAMIRFENERVMNYLSVVLKDIFQMISQKK
jgi:very-short-patch-repair endonuclease